MRPRGTAMDDGFVGTPDFETGGTLPREDESVVTGLEVKVVKMV